MVHVSVIIPTYNRAQSLKDTLASLVAQEVKGLSYEILVMDNNSSDHTQQIVHEIARKSPCSIRYFFEPRQGISYARNTGIEKAQGDILAFTDDDVVAAPDWIQSVWDCFEETDACALGGRIERLWHCEKPNWYSEEIGGSLIHQDLGPVRQKWIWENRHMVGANIAFRRGVFEKVGLFREDLGRRGDSLVGGEDREMFLRLKKACLPVYYEPKALIWHKVENYRLSQDFITRWFWHIGETLGHGMQKRWYHAVTVAPAWVWKSLASSLLQQSVSMIARTSASKRFAARMWTRHYAAMLKERWIHWLPGNMAGKYCTFASNSKNKNRGELK